MAKKAASSRKSKIKMCCDRILTGMHKVKAMQLAIDENPTNGGMASNAKRFGASAVSRPKMALIAGKKWMSGRTLAIYFLDGTKTQREKTIRFASQWSAICGISFDFKSTKAASNIRISFSADEGSWSYIGTDNLAIPKSEPTMNYGWLNDATADPEWERVVVHEFGHALGAIHEHSNPRGGIQWNKSAVYKYFSGPPNNWSKEDIDLNVMEKYEVNQLNGTKYDPKSIMLYEFDGALIKGGKGTQSNRKLSSLDKSFIKKQYPKSI